MKFGKGLIGAVGGALLGLGHEMYKSNVAKKTTQKAANDAVRTMMDGEVKNMIHEAFHSEFKDMAREELANVIADLLKKD